MKYKLYKDNRALSLSSLTEAVIGIILILLVLVVVIVGMNTKYNQTYDPTFGLATEETKASLESYQTPLESGLSSDASTSAIGGVNIVGAWGMIYSGIRISLDFVTGAFIQNAIGLLRLGVAGDYLGWALRLLFIFAISFIIIKILFKVKP